MNVELETLTTVSLVELFRSQQVLIPSRFCVPTYNYRLRMAKLDPLYWTLFPKLRPSA